MRYVIIATVFVVLSCNDTQGGVVVSEDVIVNNKKCFVESEQSYEIPLKNGGDNIDVVEVEKIFGFIPYCGDPGSLYHFNDLDGSMAWSGDDGESVLFYRIDLQLSLSYDAYSYAVVKYDLNTMANSCLLLKNMDFGKKIDGNIKLFNDDIYFSAIDYGREGALSSERTLSWEQLGSDRIKKIKTSAASKAFNVITDKAQIIGSINNDDVFFVKDDELHWYLNKGSISEDLSKIFINEMITGYVSGSNVLKTIGRMKDDTVKFLLLDNCGDAKIEDFPFDVKAKSVFAYDELEGFYVLITSPEESFYELRTLDVLFFDKETKKISVEAGCSDIISLEDDGFLCSKRDGYDLILVFYDKNLNVKRFNMGAYADKSHDNIVSTSNGVVIINDTVLNPTRVRLTFLNYKTDKRSYYFVEDLEKIGEREFPAGPNNRPVLTPDGILILDAFKNVVGLKTNLSGLSNSKFPRGLFFMKNSNTPY